MNKPFSVKPCVRASRSIWRQLRQTAAALTMSVVTLSSSAAELVIHAYPSEAGFASQLPSCSIELAFECKATLVDAVAVIQTPQWQSSLTGRYTTVRVLLAPGTHRLLAPLTLHWGSDATNNVQLEIAGESQAAVISGAVPLANWVRASSANLPARVSSKVRDLLWVADVSSMDLPLNVIPHARGYGLPQRPELTELFVNSAIQPLAAWPNIGFGKLARPENVPVEDKKTFFIHGRSVSDWADEPDLRVLAFWRWDWASQSYLVANKDIAKNSLVLFGAGSPYGIKSGQRARVENALAELDSTGEWYLDRTAAKLYYLPSVRFDGHGSELAVATSLLQIAASSKVLIHDLVFEKTRGDAVSVTKSHDIVFDHVTIRFTGNRALTIEESASSGIRNSVIEDNGSGAVLLTGGDRNTLQSAGNFVETSIISRFSRLFKTMGFAISIAGVGQRVVGNTISNAPHTAIFFKGNNHLISNNEIFDVVRETSDAGAIYIGRDFTERGTVIDGNFIHDIQAGMAGQEVKGVYLDDEASGITIRDNIFARVQQPVFIGGGRDNLVENNLFFESSPAIRLDARGLGTERHNTLDPKGTLQRGLNAVPYRGPIYANQYPNLANIREDDIGAPKYNTFRNNLIIDSVITHIDKSAQNGIEISNNKQTNDSILIKNMPSNLRRLRDDFRLKPN